MARYKVIVSLLILGGLLVVALGVGIAVGRYAWPACDHQLEAQAQIHRLELLRRADAHQQAIKELTATNDEKLRQLEQEQSASLADFEAMICYKTVFHMCRMPRQGGGQLSAEDCNLVILGAYSDDWCNEPVDGFEWPPQ